MWLPRQRVHTLPAKQVDDPVLPRHRRAVADHAVPPHGETGAQRREAGRGRGGKPGTQVRRPRRVHQGCQERCSVAPGTQLQQPEPVDQQHANAPGVDMHIEFVLEAANAQSRRQ